jgi:uncharacterized membrane protein YccF (DUF307 family)
LTIFDLFAILFWNKFTETEEYMRLIGNIVWVLFGGLILGILWSVAGILLCISIIGIPLGIQCFKFAIFTFWPFGRDIELGSGLGSFLLNVLWILFFGWELAMAALVIGLVWCLTIIGIPFGLQSFKFAKLALMPFGSRIVRI